MQVGFIGLGAQGTPMAVRIGEVFELRVWARRPETIEGFAGRVAGVDATPKELAQACEVVCLCVRADDDVETVCRGDDGVLAGLAPGATLVVHSTVHPDTVRRLAEDATALGIDVLDAPVSGANAAAEGKLVTIVGGDDAVLERVRPVLATHSDRIFHVGAIGAGQVAKLVNNALFTAQLGLAGGALHAGEALGLDPAVLRQVLAASSSRSFAMDVQSGFGADLADSFGGKLLVKDVRLLAALAVASGVDAETVLDPAERVLRLRP